ncbi:MAG: hypothetical protein ABI920_17225 [Casimicrobiaceae bacterium]
MEPLPLLGHRYEPGVDRPDRRLEPPDPCMRDVERALASGELVLERGCAVQA